MLPGARAVELPGFAQKLGVLLPKVVGQEQQPDAWYLRSYHPFGLRHLQLRPFDYRTEAGLLALALVYLLVYLLGRSRNRNVVKTWTANALPLLRDEFAAVAVASEDADKDDVVVWNGAGDAVAYASGRRGVESMHALFRLKTLYDPLHFIGYTLYDVISASPTPSVRDTLVLTFRLPYLAPDNVGGVFAVVNKNFLRATRKGRYDLSFTKLGDADDATEKRGVDTRFAIMSETGEWTDLLLGEPGERGKAQRDRVGLVAALNSEGGQLLESFVLTDQPFEKPMAPIPVTARTRRLVVSMRMPLGDAECRASLALVEAACNVVDAMELGPAKLRDATLAKLRKTRADVDRELEEEATKEEREEEEERRLAAKADKFKNLSEKEQARRKELERKRKMRKAAAAGGGGGGTKMRAR